MNYTLMIWNCTIVTVSHGNLIILALHDFFDFIIKIIKIKLWLVNHLKKCLGFLNIKINFNDFKIN